MSHCPIVPRVMKLVAVVAVLAAGATASWAGATRAVNHPPVFPKVKRTTTTTNFQYDDNGYLMGAVTKVKLVSKPTDPDGDRLFYKWKASNGKVRGLGLKAVWTRVMSHGEVAPGTLTLTVSDGHGGKATAKFVFT